MRRYKRFVFLALMMVLLAWSFAEYLSWRKAQEPFDYGLPTPLADDQPMRTAVCAIRRELELLPLPIVDEYVYHEDRTEYRFAAGRFYHRPAHQIVLTDEAHVFVMSHSRTELIAALAPLLLSAESGGRAAAVLAGLPSRSKSALSHTSELANAVQSAMRENPSMGLDWIPPELGRFYQSLVPLQLYGLGNMGSRLERSVPRNHRGSFEARLERILEVRSALPQTLLTLDEDVRTNPRQTFEEMLASSPPPKADPRFLDYLKEFPEQDILITLFPGLGQGNSAPLIDMIWLKGMEGQLWPLFIGGPIIEGDPYKAIHEGVATELIDMCPVDAL